MIRKGQGIYDLTWSRRNVAALAVLCVVSAGALTWRCARRRVQLGDEIAVHPGRVESAAERIDPNTATVASLRRLPGIGPTKALAIVAERQKRPFFGPDELMRVRGIGPKTVRNIRPLLKMKAPNEQ